MCKLLQLIKDSLKTNLKITVAAVTCGLVIIAAILLLIRACHKENSVPKEIVLQDTPIEIEEIRPKGDLYVCSAVIEDYTTVHRTEKHLGLISEKHSCVQIVRQKCSYKIDLEAVEYIEDGDHRLIVRIPEPEFTASTQNTPFLSDDEAYWIKELPNTNPLKRKVEKQIRNRYDTAANRKKATRYAEEAIRELMSQLGYEVEFTSVIRSKQEEGGR